MRTASWKVPQGAKHQMRLLHISDDPDEVIAMALQGLVCTDEVRPEDRELLIAPHGRGYSCPVSGIRRILRPELEEYFRGDIPPDLDPDHRDVWFLWISRSDLTSVPGSSDAVLDGDELRHLVREAVMTRPQTP